MFESCFRTFKASLECQVGTNFAFAVAIFSKFEGYSMLPAGRPSLGLGSSEQRSVQRAAFGS